MTRLIPPRIDREDVEECMQRLYELEEMYSAEHPDWAREYRAGRVVLERVLERDEADRKIDELFAVVDGEKEAENGS